MADEPRKQARAEGARRVGRLRAALYVAVTAVAVIALSNPLLRLATRGSLSYQEAKVVELIDSFNMMILALGPGGEQIRSARPDPAAERETRRLSISVLGMIRGRTLPANLDSLGFRERERPPVDAPRHGCRVVCAGDSWTWGMGVAEGERFTDRLGARLTHDLGPEGAEVWNAGVLGAGSDSVRELVVRDVLPFRPDVVVISPGANDLRLSRLGASPDRAIRGGAIKGSRYLLDSLEVTHALRFALARAGALDREGLVRTADPAFTPAAHGENVRATARAVRAAGAAPLVWIYPLSTAALGLGPYQQAVARVAEEEGVPAVDVAAVFAERTRESRASGAPLATPEWLHDFLSRGLTVDAARELFLDPALYVDYIHPSAEGHALIAEALAPAVEELARARGGCAAP